METDGPQTYNNDLLNEKARKVASKAMDYLASVDYDKASPERIAAAADACHASSAIIDATFEDEGDEVVAIH